MKLITPKLHLLVLITFCCFEDMTNNPIEHPDISSNDMVPDSENALSSRKRPKHSANMVEDELPHGEMPEPKAMKVAVAIPTSTMEISTAEPEHDLAKLLPTDPFGMDSSTSWN